MITGLASSRIVHILVVEAVQLLSCWESLRLDSCTVDVEFLVVFRLQILDIWPYLLCFREYDGDISSSRLSKSNLRGVHHGW
jgi:hypothetical protein